MLTEINTITRQFFQKENLQSVSNEELESFINKYPYNASVRFLLAQKVFEKDSNQNKEELLTAGLYFSNPLWLDHLLSEEVSEIPPDSKPETNPERGSYVPLAEVARSAEVGPESASTTPPEPIQPPQPTPKPEDSIVFQSYHTIDYFASQGIRLQQGDLTKDRFGQQLKSFTDWLRSMKKLPANESAATPQDEAGQQRVIRNAEASVREKEVVTEAMAEVWIKQGHPEKAIDIYNKLSLLDPAKSAYFATKIDQLK